MPRLILHPRYDEDSQLLWQAATTRGWTVWRSQSFSDAIPHMGESAVYGGYMWTEQAAEQLSIPLYQPPDDWLVSAPHGLKRRIVERCRVQDIARFPAFVKSLRWRALDSRIYHSAADFPSGSKDEEVLAQIPVRWEKEYRVFVVDQVPRAVSRYAVDHALAVLPSELDHPAAKFVSNVGDLLPMGAYAVDVGLVEGGGWGVVELNPAWCSALYACEPSAVLDVVAASCGVREGAR